MSSDSDKKLWTWQSALADHVRIMVRIPMMLLAPAFLTASHMEAVESVVSSVNSSNISSVWHKEMQRIVGPDRICGVAMCLSFGRTDGSGNAVATL